MVLVPPETNLLNFHLAAAGIEADLSMKVLEAAAEPERKNFEKPRQEAQKPSLDAQLAALQSKFRVKS